MASPAQPTAAMAALARMLKAQVRCYSAPVDAAIPASKRKYIPSSGAYPKGFAVSGTHVGVKPSNTKFPDLALISSETPCSAAAVFTTNVFQAAPVRVCKRILDETQGQNIRSVVINSGCANAVTGKGGLEDAESMATKVDEYTGAPENGTLVMSTGVIGQRYVPKELEPSSLLTHFFQPPSLQNPLQNPRSPCIAHYDSRCLAQHCPRNLHYRYIS